MSDKVGDLEPGTMAMALRFRERWAATGLRPFQFTQTLRTMNEQLHLYAKGRKIPGEPCHHEDGVRPVGTCAQHPLGATVTNAKPGQSPHNYGCAFDISFLAPDPYPEDKSLWEKVGAIMEESGLAWGGRFPHLPDRPHAQHPRWREIAAAREAKWQETERGRGPA